MFNEEELSYNEYMLFCSMQEIPNDVYTENHHYIPKHMGGENNGKNNHLVKLTYEQHIIAHKKLYEEYGLPSDLIAVRLMNSIEPNRKQDISKAIGEHHKKTGHIYRLGKHNVESGFLESIKTHESRSRGGIRAGEIAKETGQIYNLATPETCSMGGKIGGNIAKETGQIQKLGKYKSEYVIIDPNGNEYQHLFMAVEKLNIEKEKLRNYARYNKNGFTRRVKTETELKDRWSDIS